jgi:hypothetical protein
MAVTKPDFLKVIMGELSAGYEDFGDIRFSNEKLASPTNPQSISFDLYQEREYHINKVFDIASMVLLKGDAVVTEYLQAQTHRMLKDMLRLRIYDLVEYGGKYGGVVRVSNTCLFRTTYRYVDNVLYSGVKLVGPIEGSMDKSAFLKTGSSQQKAYLLLCDYLCQLSNWQESFFPEIMLWANTMAQKRVAIEFVNNHPTYIDPLEMQTLLIELWAENPQANVVPKIIMYTEDLFPMKPYPDKDEDEEITISQLEYDLL